MFLLHCLYLSLISVVHANYFTADDPSFSYFGRFVLNASPPSAAFAWTGSTVAFTFTGTSLTIIFQSDQAQYDILVDGVAGKDVFNPSVSTPTKFPLVSGLSNQSHSFVLRKRTEGFGHSPAIFFGAGLDEGSTLVPTQVQASRRIETIGDSITCGYGVLGKYPCSFSLDTEDYFSSYTANAAVHFGADINVVAWSGKGMIRNYGSSLPYSLDPMPTYYPFALDVNQQGQLWNFSFYLPDLVLINLGTNDYSTQPSPSDASFEQAYSNLIKYVRQQYANNPQIGLVCGPLIGNPCCSYVQAVAAQWQAQGDSRVHFIDLAIPLVNPDDLGCDGHPNIQGHQKMTNKLLPAVSAIMDWQL